MNQQTATVITVGTTVQAPMARVWEFFNGAEHVTKWNIGSVDWHTPRATIDFREGGKALVRMEAKDGSMGFDLEYVYELIRENEQLVYVLGDGRRVEIQFEETPQGIKITESFEAENVYPKEHQQAGWQTILDHFKLYTESFND